MCTWLCVCVSMSVCLCVHGCVCVCASVRVCVSVYKICSESGSPFNGNYTPGSWQVLEAKTASVLSLFQGPCKISTACKTGTFLSTSACAGRRVRPHRQRALRRPSLPLTHPESHCKEVVPRPEGNSTDTFSPQLPEQGAKEWRGRRWVGGGGRGRLCFWKQEFKSCFS